MNLQSQNYGYKVYKAANGNDVISSMYPNYRLQNLSQFAPEMTEDQVNEFLFGYGKGYSTNLQNLVTKDVAEIPNFNKAIEEWIAAGNVEKNPDGAQWVVPYGDKEYVFAMQTLQNLRANYAYPADAIISSTAPQFGLMNLGKENFPTGDTRGRRDWREDSRDTKTRMK